MAQDCSSVIGDLGNEYLMVHSHSVAGCHNLNKNTDFLDTTDPVMAAKDYFQNFPYEATFPLPAFPPTKITTEELNGLDPSLDLVRRKKKWENHKAQLLKSCKHMSKRTQESIATVSVSASETEVPANVAALARHIKMDPDKFFTGSYNWYYTGGNMETISVAEKKYLVRPGNVEDGYLYMTSLEVKNGSWTPVLKDSFVIQVQKGQPVYQIDTSGSELLVRQTKQVHFMEASQETDINVTNPYSAGSETPLVSASLNSIKPGEFSTLAVDRSLLVHQVPANRTVCGGVIKELEGSGWASVSYIDAHSLFLATATKLGVVDLRERGDRLAKVWERPASCDVVSCAQQGACSVQYVASAHSAHALDLRQGFTTRWTHTLPQPPTVLKVLSRADMVDMLVVGSQRSDALVAIENRWGGGEGARAPPSLLPSPRQTLHASRSLGHSLSHTLSARVGMCLTGLCIVEDEEVNILRCTSLGDVFWQRLERCTSGPGPPAQPHLTPSSLAALDRWQAQCDLLTRYSKPIAAATSTTSPSFLQLLHDCEEEMPNMEPESWHSCSKERLTSYTDYLAPRLLEPWDIENEPDWPAPSSPAPSNASSSDQSADFTDKVNRWISAYSGTMGQSSGEIEEDERGEEEDDVGGFSSSSLSEPCSSKTAEPSPTKKRKSFISHF